MSNPRKFLGKLQVAGQRPQSVELTLTELPNTPSLTLSGESETLRLKNTDYSDGVDTLRNWISFYSADDVRQGYIGYGSTSNRDLMLINEGDDDIVFSTPSGIYSFLDGSGGDEVQIVHDGSWSRLRNWDNNPAGGVALTTGFSSDANCGLYIYTSKTLADDATTTWTLRRSIGLLFINTSSSSSEAAVLAFHGTTIVTIHAGADVSVGASGTNPDFDGDVNIWLSAAGTLSIRNRRNGSRTFAVYQMAG